MHLEPMLLALLVGANGFAAGVAEEIVFRGLVLYALVRAWSDDLHGLIRAVAVSSFLFASPHLLNLLAGNDPWFTGAQLVWAFLLGAAFALLVLVGGSLWPVALVHGLGNAVMHLNRLGETVAPEPTTAVLLATAPIPLVVYTAWLFGRSRARATALTPS
ncbi:MAG: CPBP family intramembrane glutamic endopeptidase [Acidobacteriota bacterium]